MKATASILTFICGSVVGMGVISATQAPPEPKKEEPAFRSLDANLFMQTAAEYRACCYQAYTLAEERLKAEMAKPYGGAQRAVILDLDETVLDNGRFQSTMLRHGWAYDQKVWDRYEKDCVEEVGLIPGAKAFLESAKSLGVAVVYITNRNEKTRETTKAILERHGISVPDSQLFMATTTSDKTERRKKVTETFNVVMLVGDNLRDFDERFKYQPNQGIKGRKEEVDSSKAKFGTTWIILPNSSYGEWGRALGNGAKDVELLLPAIDLKP